MTTSAKIERKRRFPIIWLLPIIALVVAGWMVYQTEFNKGPVITIEFENAEGLQTGKTKLKCRSVDVGLVESIELNDQFSHAIVKVRVDKPFGELLKIDSKFWVVKPRIGNDGVSGMGTLLSGAYIEVNPGKAPKSSLHFIGQDKPPVLEIDRNQGLYFKLRSNNASSISEGDPILYKGFKVGTILGADFEIESRTFVYDAFIQKEFEALLCNASRFWSISGVSVDYGVDGLKIDVNSLETIISGGVTFDLPTGIQRGETVEEGYEFQLFNSYKDILEQPYHHYAEYLLLFNASVAGLRIGAPVEYRGIQVGTVTDISTHYLASNDAFHLDEVPIPVKIRIDPGRLHYEDSETGVQAIREHMHERVRLGARASLATRNLLTGSRFITFDYWDDAESSEIGKLGDYETLPTITRGFGQIEEQVSVLLTKLNSIDYSKTVDSVDDTLADIRNFTENLEHTLGYLDAILAKEETQAMPANFKATLDQLQKTLNGLDPDSRIYRNLLTLIEDLQEVSRELSDYTELLNRQPNAILFNGSSSSDPQPPKKD